MQYIADIDSASFDLYDAPRMLIRLKELALLSLPSIDEENKNTISALEYSFKKATSNARLKRLHPGVSKFTIDQISNELKNELNSRILLNANLITLNRQQAIDKTLQRFTGWMSSIPPTGSKAELKSAVSAEVTKSLRQLKYEARRREIDQGHKLMAAIDATIGMQSQAIAMQWQSHWRQPNYDYRPDHKARDGKIYAIRGSWAMERGLINKGDGYTDEITAPAQEVYCQCNGIYLSNLSDLPESMLTAKGKKALAESRARAYSQ